MQKLLMWEWQRWPLLNRLLAVWGATESGKGSIELLLGMQTVRHGGESQAIW